MAHETLKNLITNNIKTNGHNAITAQILQDVLIAMVDEYPDISGYATRTWVQQQDYAPKDWVENKHYATQDWANLKFNNYLPLEGGTMAGPITYGNETDGKYEFFSQGLIFSKGVNRYAEGVAIGLDEGTPYIHFFWRGGQLIGTEITQTNVTSDAFIKRNGTAAQFLKADGSVDENTYATASALSGYLPLTGGTISGDLTVSGNVVATAYAFNIKKLYLVSGWQIQMVDRNDDNSTKIGFNSNNVLYLNKGMKFGGSVEATSFVKSDGTADQVLCADGSVKTLSELKAALNAI